MKIHAYDPPPPPAKSIRLPFVDAAKTVAILLIVIYHTVGRTFKDIGVNTADYSTYFYYLIYGVSTIGVPLFFVINGYLILNRPLIFRKHIYKTLNLYFLTLTWSLIAVLCAIKIRGETYSTSGFVDAVLFLKLGVNNHLWFLFTLVSIYLLTPLIKIVFDYPDKKMILWLLIVLFIFTFGNVFANWCLNIIRHFIGHAIVMDGRIREVHPFDTQTVNPFSGRAWAFVYFIIGGLLGQNPKKFGNTIPAWGLYLVFSISLFSLFGYGLYLSAALDGKMFDTVWEGYNSIPGLTMTLSVFLLLQNHLPIDRRLGPPISSIGANTLGIYLLHLPIQWFLNPYYHRMAISQLTAANLVYAIAVFLISWLLAWCFKKIPGIAYLFRL